MPEWTPALDKGEVWWPQHCVPAETQLSLTLTCYWSFQQPCEVGIVILFFRWEDCAQERVGDLSKVPWAVMAKLGFVSSESSREGLPASQLLHEKDRSSADTPVQPCLSREGLACCGHWRGSTWSSFLWEQSHQIVAVPLGGSRWGHSVVVSSSVSHIPPASN